MLTLAQYVKAMRLFKEEVCFPESYGPRRC